MASDNINKNIRNEFWWQSTQWLDVHPYLYPKSRIELAKINIEYNKNSFLRTIKRIEEDHADRHVVIEEVISFVQNSLIHNPIFQPAVDGPFTSTLRKLGYDPDKYRITKLIDDIISEKPHLILDPDLLIELGEARCGQAARILCRALEIIGIEAVPVKLRNHIVTEAKIEGTSYLFDVDAFKNGIIPTGSKKWLTSHELNRDPTIVDKFKHTGWMFRTDSRYAINQEFGKPYTGYIDLYTPEEQGLISWRYGATEKIIPPGVPKWKLESNEVTLSSGESATFEFDVTNYDKASHYIVRIGKTSKNYSYDHIVPSMLANETSSIIWEKKITDKFIEITIDSPGAYFLTAVSVPVYAESHSSYLWWSNEILLNVI